MSHCLPYSVALVVSLSLYLLGGVVHAVTDRLWMLFIAMVLKEGVGYGLAVAIMHTYIGELGTRMDKIRKEQHKKPRKFILYVSLSFLLTGGYVVTFSEYRM